MKMLEQMFIDSLDSHLAKKTQDEDVDSDEDLVQRNIKDSKLDLKNSVHSFIGLNSDLKRAKTAHKKL